MSKKSFGGMREDLLFYKIEDVATDDKGNVVGYLQGAIPFKLSCVKDTVSYECNPKFVDSEEYYSSVVNGVVSDVNPINMENITSIKRNKCICIIQSKTGKMVQLGTPSTPISLESTSKVAENYKFNGMNITINYNSEDMPIFR